MSLREAFVQQSDSCGRLGSPFMAQMFRLLADHWPQDTALDARIARFSGDLGPSGASVPLRIGGGLHALVLSRRAPALAEVFPPRHVPDARLLPALLDAMRSHEGFLLDWIESPPQTNEVRRSAALIGGAHVAAARFRRPVVLSELGASGGLNLMWDRFALKVGFATLGSRDPALTLAPDWNGPVPPRTAPDVVDRAGVDLNPLDPRDPQNLMRLCAYLWADQPERLALTRAAAEVMDARLVRADAIDWLAARLDAPREGHLHLIQHTVAWQYFPAEQQAHGKKVIEAAGGRATDSTPLAWLAMESDGDTTGKQGAALTLKLWPGDETLHLGRADFHGRWIDWAGAS
ncbi:DUF2332 family protein [Sulfitobacter sp. D35]|uniref:DUF2332 domain-containing protein n=1 Tax=Sulfitobacter sp. D35 TaxID=3083252 RepID=UPI00296EA438|nr:DUF2332 family protein [Sulfitobacter sp. D35]MDW4498664.1 DUF2332 family protein [Sulfitobacter sp. D35]